MAVIKNSQWEQDFRYQDAPKTTKTTIRSADVGSALKAKHYQLTKEARDTLNQLREDALVQMVFTEGAAPKIYLTRGLLGTKPEDVPMEMKVPDLSAAKGPTHTDLGDASPILLDTEPEAELPVPEAELPVTSGMGWISPFPDEYGTRLPGRYPQMEPLPTRSDSDTKAAEAFAKLYPEIAATIPELQVTEPGPGVPPSIVSTVPSVTKPKVAAAIMQELGATIMADPDKFMSSLRSRGSSPEANTLLKWLAPQITEKGLAQFWGPSRMKELVEGVLPGVTLDEVQAMYENNPEELFDKIREGGRTDAKVAFLSEIGFSADVVRDIFRYNRTTVPVGGVDTDVTVDMEDKYLGAYDNSGRLVGRWDPVAGDFTPLPEEHVVKDWVDAFTLASVGIADRGTGYFLSLVPSLVFPDIGVTTGKELAQFHGRPETVDWDPALITAVNNRNRGLRDYFHAAAGGSKLYFEDLIAKHPEWQPRKEWDEGILQHPEFLKSPSDFFKYAMYEIMNLVPYAIGTIAVAGSVTAITKNPFIAVAASSAVITYPVESEGIRRDLVGWGMSEAEAAAVAVKAGVLIGLLEGVGHIPFIKAVAPLFMKEFRRKVSNNMAQGLAAKFKTGAATASKIYVAEPLTEVLQEGVSNFAIKFNADENHSLFEGLADVGARTLIGITPFAVLPGVAVASRTRVSPSKTVGLTDAQLEGKGFQEHDGNWYEEVAELTLEIHPDFQQAPTTQKQAEKGDVGREPGEGVATTEQIGEALPVEETQVSEEVIKAVTSTDLGKGAVGLKAITPRVVAETSENKGSSILDYGAGKEARHTTSLRDDGFTNVTAYDIGENVVEGRHDPEALSKQYDTVMASNVLNVAPNEAFLNRTLTEIQGAVAPEGRAILNYPVTPRKMGLSVQEMEGKLKESFDSVERVGGTSRAPVWEVRKPKTTQVLYQKGRQVLPSSSAVALEVEKAYEKLTNLKKPNSRIANNVLDHLEFQGVEGVDVTEAREALEAYQDLSREDFFSSEEYADARKDAWEEMVESVGDVVESLEDAEAPAVVEGQELPVSTRQELKEALTAIPEVTEEQAETTMLLVDERASVKGISTDAYIANRIAALTIDSQIDATALYNAQGGEVVLGIDADITNLDREALGEHRDSAWGRATRKSISVRNEIYALLEGRTPKTNELERLKFKTLPVSPEKLEALRADLATRKEQGLPTTRAEKRLATEEERDAARHGNLSENIKESGINAVFDYLKEKGILSIVTKPVLSVPSSCINCRPSKVCAYVCYAFLGRAAGINAILKSELIDAAVNKNPQQTAKIIAAQWEKGGLYPVSEESVRKLQEDIQEYEAREGREAKQLRRKLEGLNRAPIGEKALRMFDRGDGHEGWLKLIGYLNEQNIRTHIFSKRPDFLALASDQNVRLLSIDSSNAYKAEDNTLPIALNFAGVEDLALIEKFGLVGEKGGRIQLILPVRFPSRAKQVAMKEAIGVLSKTYPASKKLQCPIDNLTKTVADTYNPKPVGSNWNCPNCDVGKGRGCFYDQPTRANMFEGFSSRLKNMSHGEITGQVTFGEDGRVIIGAFSKSTIADVIHELAHIFRKELTGSDLVIAEKWAGVKDGIWTREAEEKFANGFVRYLRKGKTPNPRLNKVFAQFKKWLTSIYKTLKGSPIDIKLSPEITGVFDRLLGEAKVEPTSRQTVTSPPGPGVSRPSHAELREGLRDTLDEVLKDVQEVRKVLRARPRADMGARLSNLVLKGTKGEIQEAQSLVKRIEAGEKLTQKEIAGLESKIAKLREQSALLKLKMATEAETKKALVDFIKAAAPLNVRGKMLTAVKNVRTPAGLERAIAQTEAFVETNSQRILRTQIRDALRKLEGRRVAGIRRGKFTPETEALLIDIQQQISPRKGDPKPITLDEVNARIQANARAFMEGKITEDELFSRQEALRFAGIKGMNSEQLTEVLSTIQTLKSEGRTQRRKEREEKKARNEVNTGDAVFIITGGKGLKPGAESLPVDATEVSNLLGKVNSYQFNWDTIMRKLSQGVKKGQDFLIRFGEKVHAATNEQVIGTEKYMGQSEEAARTIYGAKNLNQTLNAMGRDVVTLGTYENTDGNSVTLSLTPNQIGDIYHKLQDPTRESNFREGMKWTDAMMGSITKYMEDNPLLKKRADWIFNFYNEDGGYVDTIAPVYERTFHTKMPRHQSYSPSPVEGDFGQAGEVDRRLQLDEMEVLRMVNDTIRVETATNPSLKSRTDNTRPLKFNDMEQLLANHITQMEHFKAYSPLLSEYRGVFGNPDVRQGIQQYHGKPWLSAIDYYLNSFARGGMDPAHAARTLDFLRKSFTLATLGIKPVIMLKQVPSVFGYMTTMPTKDFFTGTADFWTNPVENYRFLLANSSHARSRFGAGHERDIRDAVGGNDVTLIRSRKFRDAFMSHIRLGDKFAVTQGMWAKFQSELKSMGVTKDTATERQIKDAMFSAENVTRRTQPAFELATLSRLQGEKSLWKIFTMFQNQPGQYYRMQANAIRDIRYRRGEGAKPYQTLLLTWVVLPSLFQFIADAFQFKTEHQLRAWVLGPLNFILVGGSLAQSMYNWVAGDPFRQLGSPIFSTFDDIRMAFSKARKLKDPYGDIDTDILIELVERMSEVVGQVVGLPTPWVVQAERSVRGAYDEQDVNRLKELFFSPWALESPTPDTWEKSLDEQASLGMPKEVDEEKRAAFEAARIKSEVFFTNMGDLDSALRKIHGHTLPQEIILDKNASPYDKSWAEKELVAAQSEVLPNIPLYRIVEESSILMEASDLSAVEALHKLWARRMELKTQRELDKFDSTWNDPPKGIHLVNGNITQKQLELLKAYESATPDQRKQMLVDNPLLKTNRRVEWFKAHPLDNALMAVWGRAEIHTMEAYDEAQRLVDELDIPANAIPVGKLPPTRDTAESHFTYLDALEEFSSNSAEAKLVLAKDDTYRLWRKEQFGGFDPIDTPIAALELQVADRALYDQENLLRDTLPSIPDKDSPRYKEGYQYAIAQLKENNPDWVVHQRQITAIKKGSNEAPTPQEHINYYTERGRIMDKFGDSSTEVNLWAVGNLESYRWHLDNFDDIDDDGGLPDDDPRIADGRHSDKWNVPKMRLVADPAQRATQALRDELTTDEEIEEFKADPTNKEWLENTWKITAYEWDMDMTDELIDAHVALKQLQRDTSNNSAKVKLWRFNDKTGYTKMRTSLPDDHPGHLEPLDTDQVPVWRIDVAYRTEDNHYDVVIPEQFKGIADPQKRALAEADARAAYLAENPEYRKDRRRREAYELGIAAIDSKFVEEHVAYYEFPERGQRRERWLLEHKDYYEKVYLRKDDEGNLAHARIDFNKIPDVRFDDLLDKWIDQVDALRDIDKKVLVLAVPTERNAERRRLQEELFSRYPGLQSDLWRKDAYSYLVPKPLVEAYVGYQEIKWRGKPDDWVILWEDDRWLKDHPGLYQLYRNKRWITLDRDFSLVPTREFEIQFNTEYSKITRVDRKTGKEVADMEGRLTYRRRNPKFDVEGVRVGIFTARAGVPRGGGGGRVLVIP